MLAPSGCGPPPSAVAQRLSAPLAPPTRQLSFLSPKLLALSRVSIITKHGMLCYCYATVEFPSSDRRAGTCGISHSGPHNGSAAAGTKRGIPEGVELAKWQGGWRTWHRGMSERIRSIDGHAAYGLGGMVEGWVVSKASEASE